MLIIKLSDTILPHKPLSSIVMLNKFSFLNIIEFNLNYRI